jgi:hypothetical protein
MTLINWFTFIVIKYDVVIMTAQQPQREFHGRSRLIQLTPHEGEGRYLGFFPMDHVSLIK